MSHQSWAHHAATHIALFAAEQAYATITIPRLSFNEDADVDAKPSAKPRLVKQLPLEIEDVEIFDIFRPYGPIASAQRITTNSQGRHTGFRGTALVTFYDEKDAQRAQDDLHCAEVEGNTISVSIDTVSTRPAQSMPSFSASATPFVPSMPSSSSSSHHLNATAPTFQPLRPDSYSSSSPPLFQSHQMDKPSLSLPGNAAHIDPCNLFCKNLDPGIDSTDLSTIFRPFGSIISARVMRDERGVSKGFGFVSFSKAEEASLAMQAMDKSVHGNKQMIVRLHEPKRIRQEKLSQQYGSTHTGSSGVEPLDTPSEGLVDSEESSSSFDGESPRISAEKSERQRLEEAVSLVLPPHDPTEEIIDLLMGLPSKERAMSLFNQDYLRRKVEEAKDILAIEDDNETTSDQAAPAQLTKENIELATASPQIGTESKSVSDNIKATYTLTELAALPAVEIIRMANSSARSSTPLPKANPAIAKETDVFIDGIQDLSLTDQKQKLGDQLFKKIKSFGVKGAPKISELPERKRGSR